MSLTECSSPPQLNEDQLYAVIDGMGDAEAFEHLAICPLIDPDRLPELEAQCAAFPETPVIVDHLARIGMSGPVKDADVRALCALAGSSRVGTKLLPWSSFGPVKPASWQTVGYMSMDSTIEFELTPRDFMPG